MESEIEHLHSQLNSQTNASCERDPLSPEKRRDCVYDVRELMARVQIHELNPTPEHPCNGDEAFFEMFSGFVNRFPANFTKGFKHDPANGELDPANGTPNYRMLLRALDTENYEFLNRAALGCPDDPQTPEIEMERVLENPQAAIAFDLEGIDSH